MKRCLFALLLLILVSCTNESNSDKDRPVDVLKQYMVAYKQKDTTTMKSLLSQELLKMTQQEAQAQGKTVDEVLKNETFFDENQKTVEFRNEKIEGDQAVVEIKNRFGFWQKVYFVKEDGRWKISKEKGFHRIIEDVEIKMKSLEEQMKRNFPLSNTNQ